MRSRLSARLAAIAGLTLAAGCQRDPDILPGHTRPLLRHDWPHPAALQLATTPFSPPDPGTALFEARNGLKAFIVADPADPVVRLTAAIPLGRLFETPGEAGAAELLVHLVTRGREVTRRLGDMGAGLEVEQTLDATRISLEVLPEDWRAGLDLLVGLVANPDLDPGTIERFRVGPGYEMPMAGIEGDGFRPKVELARRAFGYPLAPPDPGTVVSTTAVRALAARTLVPGRVVVGIGGPVDRRDVESTIEAATRTWARTASGSLARIPIEPRQAESRIDLVDVPSLEGWIAIGRVIGAVPDADRATLAAMAFILSERLNVAAREMRGLTNRDAALLPETANGAGLLHLRTGGRPEAVGPLVRFSWDEIRRLHDASEPVTDDELARAKGWLINAEWRGKLEGAGQASATFALEQVRRGGTDGLIRWPEAVEAITVEQVKTIAQRLLDPATMVTVVAGPLTEIRAARHPRWPIGLDDLVGATRDQR
jgi:zinc protease